jgi:hypothetical protein
MRANSRGRLPAETAARADRDLRHPRELGPGAYGRHAESGESRPRPRRFGPARRPPGRLLLGNQRRSARRRHFGESVEADARPAAELGRVPGRGAAARSQPTCRSVMSNWPSRTPASRPGRSAWNAMVTRSWSCRVSSWRIRSFSLSGSPAKYIWVTSSW